MTVSIPILPFLQADTDVFQYAQQCPCDGARLVPHTGHADSRCSSGSYRGVWSRAQVRQRDDLLHKWLILRSRRSELDNIKRQIESLAVRAIHVCISRQNADPTLTACHQEPRVVDLQRRRGNIFKSILNGIRRAFGGKPKGPKAPKPPPLDTSFGSVPSIPSAFTPVRSNFRKRLDQVRTFLSSMLCTSDRM